MTKGLLVCALFEFLTPFTSTMISPGEKSTGKAYSGIVLLPWFSHEAGCWFSSHAKALVRVT